MIVVSLELKDGDLKKERWVEMFESAAMSIEQFL